MKHLTTLLFVWLLLFNSFAATSFTEFYALSGGSNLNAGSTTDAAAIYTSTNGNWDSTTGIFTPTDGSTPASTVSVGMWASAYVDGASVGVFIGRITAVAAGVNGAITVSLTAAAGSAPSTSATGRTIKVGGAWAGMTGTTGFPLNLANILRLTNSTPNMPFFNFKNDQSYKITAAITCAGARFGFAGYASTPRDGGKATLDGNAVAAAFVPLTLSGNMVYMGDFIVSSNGNSSSASGVVGTGSYQVYERVVTANMRGVGNFAQGVSQHYIGCESYGNGVANTALDAGFRTSGGNTTKYTRCISHDNTAANIAGWHLGSSAVLEDCIADSNGTNGVTWGTGSTMGLFIKNFSAYNNGGYGIYLKGTPADSGAFTLENGIFTRNAFYGLGTIGNNSNKVGIVQYCAFGSGTEANSSGTVESANWGAIQIKDSTFVTLTSNTSPFVDAANGDFRPSSAQVWNTGIGTFTQTAGSYTGTISYPDIGAVDHLDVTNAVAFGFGQ